MRSAWISLALAAVITAPSAAIADEHLATAVAFTFVPETITVEVGATLTFVNADPGSLTDGHDLTHDVARADRLFGSDTVLIGTSTPVVGVSTLEPGLYPITCTVHPFMTGTLQVIVT